MTYAAGLSFSGSASFGALTAPLSAVRWFGAAVAVRTSQPTQRACTSCTGAFGAGLQSRCSLPLRNALMKLRTGAGIVLGFSIGNTNYMRTLPVITSRIATGRFCGISTAVFAASSAFAVPAAEFVLLVLVICFSPVKSSGRHPSSSPSCSQRRFSSGGNMGFPFERWEIALFSFKMIRSLCFGRQNNLSISRRNARLRASRLNRSRKKFNRLNFSDAERLTQLAFLAGCRTPQIVRPK